MFVLVSFILMTPVLAGLLEWRLESGKMRWLHGEYCEARLVIVDGRPGYTHHDIFHIAKT